MSEEEVQIEYLGYKITMKKSETYEEFIPQLVSKLFLTDKMKNSMSLVYLDDDGDEVPLDNDNYSEFLSEATKAILNISEESNGIPDNYDDIKNAKQKRFLPLLGNDDGKLGRPGRDSFQRRRHSRRNA